MRKIVKYVVIPLIIVILILGSLLYIKYNKKDTDNKIIKTLSGKKISDNIYGYNFINDDQNILFSNVYKDYIYYTVSDGDNVYFYKYNIYTDEKVLLNDEYNYMDCKNSNDKFYCINANGTDILDSDFKIIKSGIGENVLTSDDSYYKAFDESIYNDKNEVIFKLDTNKYKGYDYFDYQFINNKMYAYYFNLDKDTDIVCNINDNKCINILPGNYVKYNNGVYIIGKDKITIYDLVNMSNKEININIDRSEYYTNYIYNDKLYVYNDTFKRIEVIDYNNDKISYININDVSSINYYNNYMYVFSYDGDYDYYIIDIDKFNLEYVTTSDYIKSFDNILSDKIKEIKDKYNVNIHVKNDMLDFPDFTYKTFDDTVRIISSVNEINNILDKLTKEVFDSFYDNDKKGLNIYLTSTLRPKDMTTQYSDPAAYSLEYNDEYIIVMNIGIYATETNTCHELMHNIENNLNNKGEYFSDWYKLNPKNHNYTYSYKETDNNKYTIGESSKDNTYFIDSYSNSFPTEDMARIFENICNKEADSILNDYPKLQKKGLYLRDTLYKHFPSLKNSTLFNSLKES